jgi:protein-S-isoprenylcysteine O-methyltransferase Ste14
MLDYVICILGFGIIACHTWSLKYHFDMPRAPFGVKIISLLVLSSGAFLSYLLLYGKQPHIAQIFGLFLLIFSLVLFLITINESRQAKLLAAFDEKKPRTLLKTGPYAFVRHPFYSSYLIQWIGWAIAAWDLWAVVPVVGMTATYWRAASEEEAKFAETPMAEAYKQYAAVTGRFFPKLRLAKSGIAAANTKHGRDSSGSQSAGGKTTQNGSPENGGGDG